MRRAVLIVETGVLAAIDGLLIAVIVAGLALIGQRLGDVQAPDPPAAASEASSQFVTTWTFGRVTEALYVAQMRAGHHCWIYTPLGLDASRRHVRPRPLASSWSCAKR